MIVAIAWPIVFLREADFALWILPLQRVSNTSIGIAPVGGRAERRLLRASATTLGILFIDALCRWYRERSRARSAVKCSTSLAIAAGVASLVAVYQGFVDLELSQHRRSGPT